MLLNRSFSLRKCLSPSLRTYFKEVYSRDAMSKCVEYEWEINSIWEIEKSVLLNTDKTLITKPKTTEKMPGIRWYLKCKPVTRNSKKQSKFYLKLESEKYVGYKLHFFAGYYGYATFNDSTMEENEEVYLQEISHTSIQDSLSKNENARIVLGGSFSRYKQINDVLKFSDAAELGLSIKQNVREDFNIIVGKQTIKVHTFILKSESPMFAKLLNLKEDHINITDFKYEIVQVAVDYCYGQEILSSLKNDADKILLLLFADKYEFPTLKLNMEMFLMNIVKKDTVDMLASAADKIQSFKLQQACLNFRQRDNFYGKRNFE